MTGVAESRLIVTCWVPVTGALGPTQLRHRYWDRLSAVTSAGLLHYTVPALLILPAPLSLLPIITMYQLENWSTAL